MNAGAYGGEIQDVIVHVLFSLQVVKNLFFRKKTSNLAIEKVSLRKKDTMYYLLNLNWHLVIKKKSMQKLQI